MKTQVSSLSQEALVEKIGANCKGRRRRDNRSDNTKGMVAGPPKSILAFGLSCPFPIPDMGSAYQRPFSNRHIAKQIWKHYR
jgi:hypothetical protein